MENNTFIEGFKEELEKIGFSERGKKWLKGLGIAVPAIGLAAITGGLLLRSRNLRQLRRANVIGTSEYLKKIKNLRKAGFRPFIPERIKFERIF